MKHQNISEQVVSYILSRDLKKLSQLTCYKIAQQFNINISYLSGKFKKDTNFSLFDFIEQEKIMRAKILLNTRNDLSIVEISKMFGLEKTDQFRNRFKKYFFITPGKYRRLDKNHKN
jgi:two-component system, response regulator YesN